MSGNTSKKQAPFQVFSPLLLNIVDPPVLRMKRKLPCSSLPLLRLNKKQIYALTSFCSLPSSSAITYFNTWHLLHNMFIFHYSLWVLMLCEFTKTWSSISLISHTHHSSGFTALSMGAYFYEAQFQSPVIADNSKWTQKHWACVCATVCIFTLIVLWLLIVVGCLQHSSWTMKAINNGWLTLCLCEWGTAPNNFRWVQRLFLMSDIPKCHLMMQYKDRSV